MTYSDCTLCKGAGSILDHRPTIYCTDSADEIEDAYRMASRPCPDCAARKQLAEAAPDLLCALRSTLPTLDFAIQKGVLECHGIREAALAAIAKAEGK